MREILMFLEVGVKFRVINGLRGRKLYTSISSKYQELYMLEKNLVIGNLLVRQSLEKPANFESILPLITQPKCQAYLCVFGFF